MSISALEGQEDRFLAARVDPSSFSFTFFPANGVLFSRPLQGTMMSTERLEVGTYHCQLNFAADRVLAE